jgi:hypothetical protein
MKGASEEVVRSESPMADNWAAGQARVLVLWRYFGGLALEFCVIINYRSRCLFLDPLPALCHSLDPVLATFLACLLSPITLIVRLDDME